MTRRLLFTALFAMPLAAPVQATGCETHEIKTQAASCADGIQWNTDLSKCVPVVAS